MSDTVRGMAAAFGKIASGLFVLTARKGAAETGILVSWVQQCSFEPPQVSVAIRRGRELTKWLTTQASFTLNILDASQTDMIIHFGRGYALDEPAFVHLEVERSEEGNPVLSEALAYLDCRVVSCQPAGDHDLYVAQVTGGRMLNDGQPMVHLRKSGLHY